RNAQEHARATRELLPGDARRAERVVHAVLQAKTARSHVERRELVRAVAEDGNAQRLEALEGERQIEHVLRAGAHDDDRMPRDRLEVGGLIEAPFRASVHAADAAGRQDLDARGRRDLHGRRDGRAAERPRCHHGHVRLERLRHLGRYREVHRRPVAWPCSPLWPARSSTAWGRTGRRTSSDSRTARGDPGRFTTSADPTAPATPRESIPWAVFSSDFARRASAIPGTSRSITRRVASGVTSFGE